MSRKYRHNQHLLEPAHGFFCANSDTAHLTQCSSQRTSLMSSFSVQLESQASAFAMICLRQINQLKVEGKGAREQDGAFHGKRMDQFQRRGGLTRRLVLTTSGLCVAPADGALPQCFDVRKQIVACLLAQNFTKQHAQRSHRSEEHT